MDAGLSSLFEEVNNSWLTVTIEEISDLYDVGGPPIEQCTPIDGYVDNTTG
jgi:hypothetical protein